MFIFNQSINISFWSYSSIHKGQNLVIFLFNHSQRLNLIIFISYSTNHKDQLLVIFNQSQRLKFVYITIRPIKKVIFWPCSYSNNPKGLNLVMFLFDQSKRLVSGHVLFNQSQRLESGHVPIQPITKVRIWSCSYSTNHKGQNLVMFLFNQSQRLESYHVPIQPITKVRIW